MITARAFAGHHYAVYGLARSGLATVEALLASGAEVVAWDTKEEARLALIEHLAGRGRGSHGSVERWSRGAGTGWHGGDGKVEIADLTCEDMADFDALIASPGIPINRDFIAANARASGTEIIGDIELFARARPELPPHKVVGITGTNGKSTTTALVHHILKTAGVPTTMGGNIGLPILAQDPLPEGGVYVLELSSYQIDLTKSLDCDVAVLLNITPDHLDRYESFEAYQNSKLRLFEMQCASDNPAVIGETLPPRRGGLQELVPNNQLLFALDYSERQPKWPALQGPHNHQNAAVAIAVTELLGIDQDVVEHALRTYPGLPHRMERVREKDGVLFVNDSKATNPTATAPALAAFDRIRWILGGQAKTDNLDECSAYFGHVRSAYVIGEAAELFERLLSPHIPVKNCGKLDAAVRQAAADAQAGDTVLLSPACASFDQFRDFEDRGNQFRALVEGL